MDGLLQDIRLAWRGIRAKPGFSAVVIVTLALGIGVNTAVFSLANWVMLRPVPGVRDEGRLVTIQVQDHRGANGGTSYPNLIDLKAGVPAFTDIAGENRDYPLPVQVGNAKPALIRTLFVSSNYFDVLGVSLERGRSFTTAEEAGVIASPVVVVSHAFWAGSLRGDPAVVGSYVRMGGRPTRIVGVAPPGFHGSDLLGGVDLWLPASSLRMVSGITTNRQYGVFFYLRGRLARHTSIAAAQQQVRTQIARMAQAFPEENKSWFSDAAVVTPGIGMEPAARSSVGRTLAIIVGIAVLVLIVACANVANLYLFRSVARRQTIAMRRALGASGMRLARLEFIESLLAASIGGGAAIVATWWTLGLFRGRLFSALSKDVATQLDWRVFVFAFGAILLTSLLAGLAPAWGAARLNVSPVLKAGAGGHSGARKASHSVLVTLQLSISLSVIVATLLLVQTVRNLEHVDIGFSADRVVSVSVAPTLTGHAVPDAQRILLHAVDLLGATPGVEAAGLTSYTPFSYSIGDRVRLTEAPSDSGVATTTAWATPSYFATMGIHLLRGRVFDQGEEFRSSNDSGYHVAIVSASLARRLFATGDPIGQIIVAHNEWARVIGIVTDSRWASVVDEGAGPMVYSPMPKLAGWGFFVVRTALPVTTVQHRVDQIMADLSPDTPVGNPELLSDAVRRSFAEQILLSRVLSAFALITVALAGIGLYAVISFGVAQRTREIGIRMALGARIGQVMGLVLRRGMGIGLVGVLLGGAGAVALVRVVKNQLFGVQPGSPLVYVAAIVTLAAVVLVATWLPARRATKVDPAITLRAE